VLATVFRLHLVEVASGAWTFDQEGGTARRHLCVGFVDMVGYTALSRTSSTQTLVHTITRFDTLVTAALGRGGGRLVKLIGDGAMFVVDAPEDACRVALDLAGTFAADATMPPIRVGVAYGTVVASNGDYYGDAVNLAARLMAAAEPGSVVATAEVANRTGAHAVAERLPGQVLKGYTEPVAAFRISASPPMNP
jgi:class 3 adenylate cyclase